MKNKTFTWFSLAVALVLLIITIILVINSGIINTRKVTINLTVEKWSWGDKTVDNLASGIINVVEGEEFGPDYAVFKESLFNEAYFSEPPRTKPFRLLKIVSDKEIEIEFDDISLVISGDAVFNTEYAKRSVIVYLAEGKCFRTRSLDGGIDFCINAS